GLPTDERFQRELERSAAGSGELCSRAAFDGDRAGLGLAKRPCTGGAGGADVGLPGSGGWRCGILLQVSAIVILENHNCGYLQQYPASPSAGAWQSHIRASGTTSAGSFSEAQSSAISVKCRARTKLSTSGSASFQLTLESFISW